MGWDMMRWNRGLFRVSFRFLFCLGGERGSEVELVVFGGRCSLGFCKVRRWKW